jgi:hypothetical protein
VKKVLNNFKKNKSKINDAEEQIYMDWKLKYDIIKKRVGGKEAIPSNSYFFFFNLW